MATQPVSDHDSRPIPVEEYLASAYEPDREFEDGALVERNLGEFEHSCLQTILAAIFTNNMDEWGAFALTDQRVQIAPRRFLIPDVCVLRMGDPTPNILSRPPLIAIEIMSPPDTKPQMARKAAEFLRFGVQHIWIIDPGARTAYRATESGLEPVASVDLMVPGTPILVRVKELFSKLDRIRAMGRDQ